MAVPIVLSSDDTEDSYRSLDFLLEQLLITLRQVLMIRRREAASNAQPPNVRHRHIPNEGSSVDEVSDYESQPEEATRVSPEESLPLPDLVLETSRGQQSEHKEITRTRTSERSAEETSLAQTHNWVQVGEDLQRIADQLLATNRLDQIKNLVSTLSLHVKTYSVWCQLTCAKRFCRRFCCCSPPLNDH